MGRFVNFYEGNLDWEWKFWFGIQCSNFGSILQMVADEDVYVDRYIGEDGEYIRLDADKEKLLEKLKSLKIDSCPSCGDTECLTATREMVKDFTEAVEKCDENKVFAIFFVEYL